VAKRQLAALQPGQDANLQSPTSDLERELNLERSRTVSAREEMDERVGHTARECDRLREALVALQNKLALAHEDAARPATIQAAQELLGSLQPFVGVQISKSVFDLRGQKKGVSILKVKEGPALTAGLQPGFVVERVNGTLTRFNSQFSIQFQSIKPGDRVIFQVNVGDVVKCMVMLVNSRELDFDSITTLRRIAAGVLLPGDEEIVRDICKVFLAHGGVLNADALQQLTPAEELTKPIKKALGTPRMVKERTARAADSTARGEPASAPAGPSNSNNSNPPPSPAPKPSKITMPYLQFLGANPFGTARKDSTASLDSETSRRSSSPGKPKPEWNSSPVMPMNRTERIKARAQAKTSISERRPPSPQRAVEVAAHSSANTHKAQSAVKDRPSKPRTTSPVRHIDRLQSPTRNSAGQEKISERLASPRHRFDKLA